MERRRGWLLIGLGFALSAAAIVLIPVFVGSGRDDPSNTSSRSYEPETAALPDTTGSFSFRPSGPPAGKVQLLVTELDEQTVAMRSPTFRCAADYCAGAVILGLEEVLGEGNFKWSTGLVPNEEFVELRIEFDPARYSSDDIVQATRQAMERYRDPGFPAGVEVVQVPGFTDFIPFIISGERVVGDNRVALALLDTKNELILDARVRLRFFSVEGGQAVFKDETEATPITIDKFFVETHADGTVHRHDAGKTGAYVTAVRFDRAGPWQVEVEPIIQSSGLRPVRTEFEVSEGGIGLQVGDKAPASRQPILKDVGDISEIDTSGAPRTAMHTMTIADAVESGRPAVVAFATPAFCVSRVCGPVMDVVMDPLLEKYRGKVNFIHVEPYRLEEARAGEGLFPSETMEEWGLKTEPWIFVIDREGRIAAKFEGIVSVKEVETELQRVLEAAR